MYVPGVSRALKSGEEWEYDPEAYRIFHKFESGRVFFLLIFLKVFVNIIFFVFYLKTSFFS